jgi:Cu/Ag efflux protein CusF
MKCRGYWLVMIPWIVSACAAYELPPLNINHPANPAAVTASERPVSKTLAYAKADIPSRLPIASAAAAQQEGHDAHHQTNGDATNAVTGEGKIVATVPSSSQLVIEHGEIKGFMDAMTMGYRVESPALLEGLNPGDRVRFTIDIEKKTIVKVEKLG